MYRIVQRTLNYESPNSGRLLGRLTLQLAGTDTSLSSILERPQSLNF